MDNFYRRARLEEIDQIMEAVEYSREVLRLQGNGQWQDGYPTRDDFVDDIKKRHLYVVPTIGEPDTVAGVMAMTYYEEPYHHLYEGEWLSDLPYVVMHRVALKKEFQGQGYGKLLFKAFIEQASKEGFRSLRIDTHEGNAVMRHLIAKAGMSLCGRVVLPPNKDRMVFELVLPENVVTPRILENERFFFREYQEEDLFSLRQIYQDSENMKYFGAPYDERMMRRLMDWTQENYRKYGFGFWAIIDKHSGEFIGDCGLSLQNIDGELLPEIGYHINPKYHNQHYATDAARLVREYGFATFGFKSLYGYTVEANLPSISVMKNNGMHFWKKFEKGGEIYVVFRVNREE